MTSLIYDGSFDGFLTAIFDVYEYKLSDVAIVKDDVYQQNIFGKKHNVHTDVVKAKRVRAGLVKKLSTEALRFLSESLLSEIPGIENVMLQYAQHAFASSTSIEKDYSNSAVLMINETARKVHRERHRMEAFIRFELTKDNLFYAVIEPDFNVLPLLINHFEKRYADQKWLIYDSKRKYGIYYNLAEVETVTINFSEEAQHGKQLLQVYDEKESLYQSLWQRYFSSVNIKARKNMKLHIQHMPKRYWKYLTEKKGF